MGYQGRMWSQVFIVASFAAWLGIDWMNGLHTRYTLILSFALLVVEATIAWLLGWQYDRVHYYARFDLITGILNRHFAVRMVYKILQRSEKRGKPCSIFVIDGNELKRINDTHGHMVGDRAIQSIAATLRNVLPRHGLVARLGGDEFLGILPGMDGAMAVAFSDMLAKSVANSTEGTLHAISVSVGYAVFPDDGTDFHQLMKVADHRMYAEKGYSYRND